MVMPWALSEMACSMLYVEPSAGFGAGWPAGVTGLPLARPGRVAVSRPTGSGRFRRRRFRRLSAQVNSQAACSVLPCRRRWRPAGACPARAGWPWSTARAGGGVSCSEGRPLASGGLAPGGAWCRGGRWSGAAGRRWRCLRDGCCHAWLDATLRVHAGCEMPPGALGSRL